MASGLERFLGQVLAGTYRLDRLLGEGGMGAVFEASHTRLHNRFAVKMLNPWVSAVREVVQRFQREALITSELGHPHIVQVIDFNTADDGTPYIVMELLDGEDLDTLLRRQGHLSLGRALSIFRQTASALAAAHERGIVHRDLKPANIFVCRRDDEPDFVKVVDFGISKVLGAQTAITRATATIGTPAFMSPEQAEGRSADVDARSDIYSLGSILFAMLAGQPPFVGDTVPTLLYQVVHAEPPPLRTRRPDLPESVESFVGCMLRKVPAERPSSARELLEEAERILGRAAAQPERRRIVDSAAIAPTVARPVPETLSPPAPAGATFPGNALAAPVASAAVPIPPTVARPAPAADPEVMAAVIAAAKAPAPAAPPVAAQGLTTLSGGAGELEAGKPRSSSLLLPLGVLGAAVLIAGALVVAALLPRRGSDAPSPSPQPNLAVRPVAPQVPSPPTLPGRVDGGVAARPAPDAARPRIATSPARRDAGPRVASPSTGKTKVKAAPPTPAPDRIRSKIKRLRKARQTEKPPRDDWTVY